MALKIFGDGEAPDRVELIARGMIDPDEEEEVGLVEDRERIVEMIVAYGAHASLLLADKFDSANIQSAPYILSALATVNPEQASSLAMNVISTDSPSSLRSAAIETLGDLDAKAHVAAFRNALHDPQGSVRAAAATALGETRSKDEAETLITIVNDSSPLVRRRAMKALELCVGEKHNTPEEWLAWWDASQATEEEPEETSAAAPAG